MALLTPLLWITWDIPIGYYQFQKACSAEGGLRVFEKTEPADRVRLGQKYFSKSSAEYLLQKFPSLKIVDAQNEPGIYGRYFNYSRMANKIIAEESYETGAKASYFLEQQELYIGIRLHKIVWTLRNGSGKTLAQWTELYYLWSDPSNTLLGRSGGPGCFQSGSKNELPFEILTTLIAK